MLWQYQKYIIKLNHVSSQFVPYVNWFDIVLLNSLQLPSEDEFILQKLREESRYDTIKFLHFNVNKWLTHYVFSIPAAALIRWQSTFKLWDSECMTSLIKICAHDKTQNYVTQCFTLVCPQILVHLKCLSI